MGRDLLYKPQVPVVPELDEEGDKLKKGEKAKKPDTKRVRELGRVGETLLKRTDINQQRAPRAFQNEYFNKDVGSTTSKNLNQSDAKALRGSEEATNLRKVVLPPAIGVDTPDPSVLNGALDLMGAVDGFTDGLADLLNRQGTWARGEGVTVEMLEERLRQLEEMVAARKAALERIMAARGEQLQSTTLQHALSVGGAALDQIEDVAAAGSELIQKTLGGADGMHRRLAKALGLKLPK